MDKEFLNINEVSEYLGIKKSTLYFHVENGDIPHYRIGRLIRFKKQDIGIWMEGNKKEKIDLHRKALKILGKVANSNLDVESIVKKTIDETRRKRYIPLQEKPGGLKGLRKEVENGLI
jgi:excisionase family DNA binding protein